MIKLDSLGKYNFGTLAGAVSLIYSKLLIKYNVELIAHVLINHVDTVSEETVVPMGKSQQGINIYYELPNEFNELDDTTKNTYFAKIINVALHRLVANKLPDEKLKLDQILKEILDENFTFWFVCKEFHFQKNKNLIAKIVVHPEPKKFDYYLVVQHNSITTHQFRVYSGMPTTYYFEDLFYFGKWKSQVEFVLSGKRSEILIHVYFEENKIVFENSLGENTSAPLFELFKSDANNKKTLKEYVNSLDPAIAAHITQSLN